MQAPPSRGFLFSPAHMKQTDTGSVQGRILAQILPRCKRIGWNLCLPWSNYQAREKPLRPGRGRPPRKDESAPAGLTLDLPTDRRPERRDRGAVRVLPLMKTKNLRPTGIEPAT